MSENELKALGERCWKACLLEAEPPTHDTYPFAIWDRCRLLQEQAEAATEANGRHYAALQVAEEKIANLDPELVREKNAHNITRAYLREIEKYRDDLLRRLNDKRP